jgi:hypothetical protein
MTSRPIDIKRQSAFSGVVGLDSEGAIKDMYNVGDFLLFIKETAIYQMQLADQIDPDRTNIDAPHTQQKLYSVGSTSEVVNRVLVQAKYLFDTGVLGGQLDKTRVLKGVLEFFDEVVAALALFENFHRDLNVAIEAFEKQKAAGGTIMLPSIGDVGGKAKAFIQRAEHAVQRLLALGWLFYDRPSTKAWFDSFVSMLEGTAEGREGEIDLARNVAKYAHFVRNCRHCIEHPKPSQRLIVSDFKITSAARIEPPTIEIVHPETPEPKIELAVFMFGMVESLMRAGEQLMAFLASSHVTPSLRNSIVVFDFPVEERRNPQVRFYFAMDMGGRMVPLG